MDSKFRPTANPDYAKAMVELRRSGASGSHSDRRAKRARTRSAAKRRAIAQSAH